MKWFVLEADNEPLLAALDSVITREYAPLVEAARDISLCGMLDIGDRLDYIEVQVSRKEWASLQAALGEVVGDD
jgi:hypothetical protein